MTTNLNYDQTEEVIVCRDVHLWYGEFEALRGVSLTVKRGDVIARAGKSGRSTATHLHYEVVFKGQKKNPLNYVIPGNEITD